MPGSLYFFLYFLLPEIDMFNTTYSWQLVTTYSKKESFLNIWRNLNAWSLVLASRLGAGARRSQKVFFYVFIQNSFWNIKCWIMIYDMQSFLYYQVICFPLSSQTIRNALAGGNNDCRGQLKTNSCLLPTSISLTKQSSMSSSSSISSSSSAFLIWSISRGTHGSTWLESFCDVSWWPVCKHFSTIEEMY